MSNAQFEEVLGYKASEVMDLFKHFAISRKPYEKLWKMLDAYDRGYFWDAIVKNQPAYSIKPDTNWINYIKTSITNSLYTGIYVGDVFPRSKDFKDKTNEINEFIQYIWNKLDIPKFVLQAGERTALLNWGALEFGWNSDVIDRTDKLFSGDLETKYVDNLSLFLDPATVNAYRGRAMFIAEEVSLVELRNEKRFRERIDLYLAASKDDNELPGLSEDEYGKGYFGQRSRQSKDKTVRLLTAYYKYQPKDAEGYRIDQIWLIEDGYILDVKTDIRPKTFPVRILYATPPTADPYGIPVTKLVLYNAMSINILDSIESTHVYSSANRAKIVSSKSGINEIKFAKEGNNPNKVWFVNGDPNNVVRYVDVPDLPRDRHLLKQALELAIMRISGVDDRYTGRDTGSVQTTGAMDIMNQRISMSDNTRISMLQQFIREVTELVLSFYVEYGGDDRPFPKYRKNRQVDEIGTLNFEEMKEKDLQFDFMVNISPYLPNNILRRAAAADAIMEKQMQYNMNPPLMTPEEWLEAQDIPQKYHILDRMYQDRMRDDREELMSDMVNYAGMVNGGMRPESAIDQLAQERQFKREQPGLGNVAGGSTQARQM